MRFLMTLLLTAVAGYAFAQTADAPDKLQKLQEKKAQLEARFNAADANHDGKLSREEAAGKMPMVSKNFDAIDTEKNGYVTLDQIEQFAQTKMAARRAKAAE